MKFKGIVKKHLGRGTSLGFPTANLDAPEGLEDGLYFGWTSVDASLTGQKLPSLVFIGTNPTFNETFRRAEVYILDFNGDLYNKEIAVETLERLRDVNHFDSPEDLVTQMKLDEVAARKYFKLI